MKKEFHGKDVRLATPFSFFFSFFFFLKRPYTTKEKKQWKKIPLRFSEKTGKDINSTASLTEGCWKKHYHFSLRYILGPSSNLLRFRNGQLTKFKHERCNNKSEKHGPFLNIIKSMEVSS